jgi:hypothetical protein
VVEVSLEFKQGRPGGAKVTTTRWLDS